MIKELTVNKQLATQTAAHDPTQYLSTVLSLSLKKRELQGAPQFSVSYGEDYCFFVVIYLYSKLAGFNAM